MDGHPSSLPSICHGGRGGKYNEKDLPHVSRFKRAAIDGAIAVGLKLRKKVTSAKELHEAGLKWAVKSGFAPAGSTFAALLASIVSRVHINSDTNNPVWK
jgi:hypothetical protein